MISNKFKKRIFRLILISSIALFIVYSIGPIIWTFITSISPLKELYAMPKHWIPHNPTFSLYINLVTGQPIVGPVTSLSTVGFLPAMLNSLIVASSVGVVCAICGAFGGYAITKTPLPGKKFFDIGLIAPLFIPSILILPSLYILYSELHLLDTLLGLFLFHLGLFLPLSMGIMFGYYHGFPEDLVRAARVDGCSWISCFRRIVLPISVPGLVATGIISFLLSWNEYFGAFIFTSTSAAKTLPVLLAESSTRYGIFYGALAAQAMINIIPIMIIVFIFQRYMVKGLAMGALRG